MEWRGKWIWTDEAEVSPRNRWQCFRRSFYLKEGANRPERADLHITADSRYILYMNGELVGRGPARSWPFEQSYDTFEVGHLLRPGPNVVAALVLHWGVATFAYVRGRGGLLAQLEWQGANANEVLGTDGGWRTRPHPGYDQRSQRIACQLGFVEQFDSRALDPAWTTASFDDSGWPRATVIGPVGMPPWKALVPRDIAHLTEELCYPVRVESLDAVKPVAWTAALDVRNAFLPSSADHTNPVRLVGYLATVIRVAGPTRAVIGFPALITSFGPLIVNGISYSLEQPHEALPEKYVEVTLEAGDNLCLLDLSATYHGHSLPLAIDCPDPFELVAPGLSASSEGTPFALVGPFEASVVVDHQPSPPALDEAREEICEQVGKCNNLEELLIFSQWLQPFPLSLISRESPYSRFAWVKERLKKSVPAELQYLVVANDQPGIVPRFEGADSQFVVDFGRELSGYVAFETDAPAGMVLEFNGLEYMRDGWQQQTYILDNTLRYVCRAGRQRYVSAIRRGLRYLVVTVRYSEMPLDSPAVSFYGFQMRQSNYPVARLGQFQCSDERLNSIWQISQHTLQLCMEDTFVDCPAYEQTFWVGDSRNAALTAYYLFGPSAAELARHCLKLVPGSKMYTPLYTNQVPSGWNSVIPNWTFLWVLACYDYYEQTGDQEFAAQIWPDARFTLDHYLTKRNEQGLLEINAWNLLDWADLDQPNAGVVAHQNMLLVRALANAAKLAALTNDRDGQARYEQAAQDLKTAINRHLWSEDEAAYRDSIHADGTFSSVFSMQTQVMALGSQVVPEERLARLVGYLQQPPAHFVGLGSPFMSFFYYEVLARQGQLATLLDDIRANYGPMLDYGTTTCWETYTGQSHLSSDSRYLTRSYCHAWSVAPAYFLPAYVLGVRSLAPGWRKVLVAPHSTGLKWANGKVPLPDGGYFEVSWQANLTEHSLHLEISAPEGIEVIVQH